MRGRVLMQVLAAVVLALALPGAAIAHDTYVDRSDGDDGAGTNDCSSKAHPCATLGRGISQAGTGDTVFVGGDPAPFTVPQNVGDGKSIVKKDFSKKHSVDTSGKAVLDTGADSDPALSVVSDAGRVKGLTIRSLATFGVEVGAAAVFTHDKFDEQGTHVADVRILAGSYPVEVTHDKFKDSTPLTDNSENRSGVITLGTGPVVIAHNSFQGLAAAIGVGDGAPEINDNEISGTHAVGPGGQAISVSGGADPLMAGNVITPPAAGGSMLGVVLSGPTTTLSSTRDLIEGFRFGVQSQDAGLVSLDSDVFLDSDFAGFILIDAGSPDAGIGNATAVNITVTGSPLADVEDHAHLDLDSSIADNDGIVFFGDGSCTITNSRGQSPAGPPSPSGCESFSFIPNPKLKGDGYHLKASSPMIDLGNPAAPLAGAKDIDGDKRALDGTGNCKGTKRRDIGADEFRC